MQTKEMIDQLNTISNAIEAEQSDGAFRADAQATRAAAEALEALMRARQALAALQAATPPWE